MDINLLIMKNLILIACLLLVTVSFSQEDSKVISKEKVFSNVVENDFQQNTYTLKKMEKLRPFPAIKASNNTEGKFPFYDNVVLPEIESTDESISMAEDMSVNDNKVFVDNLVLKILEEKHIDISDFKNSIESNGDGKLSFYKHYAADENKLIATYQLTKEIEIQVGKDIYGYLKKVFKTEIDKTLFSSLNLLAINF